MKYLYEIMLAISILLLSYTVYAWFQIDSFEWENIKSTLIFTVTSICLVIVFGSEYLKKRKETAENESEGL